MRTVLITPNNDNLIGQFFVNVPSDKLIGSHLRELGYNSWTIQYYTVINKEKPLYFYKGDGKKLTAWKLENGQEIQIHKKAFECLDDYRIFLRKYLS